MKNLQSLLIKMNTGEAATKLNLTEEQVQAVIAEFQSELVDSLLLNGYVLINPDLRVDVVPIQNRKYVLKGIEYGSTRVYKLKASMGDPIYNRIRDRYDQFRDDIEGGE